VKRVRDPAALVMHNVIVTADGRPNEAFAWKRWIVCRKLCHIRAAQALNCDGENRAKRNVLHPRVLIVFG
jgi:hypothetical protein